MAERLELLHLVQRFLGLPLLGPVEQSGDGASVFYRTLKNLERSPIFLVLEQRRLASSLDMRIKRFEPVIKLVNFGDFVIC